MDPHTTWRRRAGAAWLVLSLCATTATLVVAQRPLVPRMSEAEKAYVAVSATEKLAEGIRKFAEDTQKLQAFLHRRASD